MCQAQTANEETRAGRPAPSKAAAGEAAGKKTAPKVPPPWQPVKPVRGQPPVLSAQAAMLVDGETGQVLWQRNAQSLMYPASLTKMMTGLLAVETKRLEEVHRASKIAAATGETGIALKDGEALKLQQALRACLIISANDAAVMVAESVAGTLPAFVDMMNARAQALGMTGTHFANPHGLHNPNHYSTAADLAILAQQAMLNPVFAKVVGTRDGLIPAPPGKPGTRKLVNRNRLLFRWDACDGVKTGYTRQAGRCLAASSTVEGWRLIAVVLKCRNVWSDAETLLQWGTLNYQRQCVAPRTQAVAVPVQRGARKFVWAWPQRDLFVIVKAGNPVPTALRGPAPCVAPIVPGQIVGKLTTAKGATTELVAAEAVPLSLWARLCEVKTPEAGGGLLVLLAAGVLLHGAGAKTARARRRRLAAREREADHAEPGDDQRGTGTTGE